MPASHCALRRSGTITVQLCSSASEEEYPKIIVAAAFHSTILPLRASTTTIASLMLSSRSSIPKFCSRMAYITPHTQPTSRRVRMGRAKALAIRFLSECPVFLHFKKHPTVEPSVSRSRLRHWLAPLLRRPSSERSSKPLPIPYSYWDSVLSGAASCNPRSAGLHVRSRGLEPATF